MDTIADALVYAVTYINLRDSAGDEDDDDVGALESVAAILSTAGDDELNALAEAANRAAAREKDGPCRDDVLRDYMNWMEDLLGEGWVGNRRQ